MHIVFDINGNDKGPQAGYNAAYEFCLKNPNDKITLIDEISLLKQNENLENLFLIENNLKVANPKNIRENLKMPT
ncbi:phosphate acyltransferase, partial [Mycoplasmopsis synoviae]